MLGDVIDRFFQIVHNAQREVQGQVLVVIFIRGGRNDPRIQSDALFITVYRDSAFAHGVDQWAHCRIRNSSMHQNRLDGIAHAGTLGFSIDGNIDRHLTSALTSMTRWQLPVPVWMTGTLAPVTTALMSPAPPRGMSKSTYPRAAISSSVTSWPPSTSCTASRISSGSRDRIAAITARVDSRADEHPRNSHAFPDFKQIPAASEVTLGRAS